MMLTTQYKLLLVVAILSVLRFGIQPWLLHQQDQKAQLELLTQQVVKVERLLNNAMYIDQEDTALHQQLQQLVPLFPPSQVSGQYQLERQQQIQQAFQMHDVQLTVFDWLSSQPLLANSIEQYQARVVLQGSPLQLMQGYQATIGNSTWIQVKQFELRERPRSRRQTQPQATLTLLLTFTSLNENIVLEANP